MTDRDPKWFPERPIPFSYLSLPISRLCTAWKYRLVKSPPKEITLKTEHSTSLWLTEQSPTVQRAIRQYTYLMDWLHESYWLKASILDPNWQKIDNFDRILELSSRTKEAIQGNCRGRSTSTTRKSGVYQIPTTTIWPFALYFIVLCLIY